MSPGLASVQTWYSSAWIPYLYSMCRSVRSYCCLAEPAILTWSSLVSALQLCQVVPFADCRFRLWVSETQVVRSAHETLWMRLTHTKFRCACRVQSMYAAHTKLTPDAKGAHGGRAFVVWSSTDRQAGWLKALCMPKRWKPSQSTSCSRWITCVSVLDDRSASRWHSNDYRPWRLERFHKGSYFGYQVPCSLNESCYITSFELVPGCFRLLRSWAGGPMGQDGGSTPCCFSSHFGSIFFVISPEEDIYIYVYIPFYSDFDLSKSTNHHLDFCDWETGETPSALREVLPKDGVAACQVWVGELGHFFDACNHRCRSRLACLRWCYL